MQPENDDNHVQIWVRRYGTDVYDFSMTAKGCTLDDAIENAGLDVGQYEVFACWPGDYGKRFNVRVQPSIVCSVVS